MVLNAIRDLWGFTCYYKNNTYMLIDNDGVDRPPTQDEQIAIDAWIASKQLQLAKLTPSDGAAYAIYMAGNPQVDTNPANIRDMVVNTVTGETFVCIDNTIDKNIWVGQLGTRIYPVPPANVFDFFSDGSTVSFLRFHNNALDEGGLYNGKEYNVKYKKYGKEFSVYCNYRGTIQIDNLPFDETTEFVTICAWLKWNGRYSVMPFGFSNNDMYVYNGYGNNTGRGDLNGITSNEFINLNKNKWAYHIITFKRDSYGDININGNDMPITVSNGSRSPVSEFTKKFNIFGWPNNSSYRNFGELARLRIINRELTAEEKSELYLAEQLLYGELV